MRSIPAGLLPAFLVACAVSAYAGPGGGPGAGPGPAAEQPTDSAGVVAVRAAPAVVPAAPGGEVSFAVDFRIAPRWHLYAHGDSVFIGIDLKGLDKAPLDSMIVEYPPGEPGEFFGEPVRLLEGAGRVKVAGRLRPDAELPLDLELELELQACDDRTCLAPARVPARVKLTPAE